MKIRWIYTKWPKLQGQWEFNLPPHGPVVFAAAVPREHELNFTDENVEPIDLPRFPILAYMTSLIMTAALLTRCSKKK